MSRAHSSAGRRGAASSPPLARRAARLRRLLARRTRPLRRRLGRRRRRARPSAARPRRGRRCPRRRCSGAPARSSSAPASPASPRRARLMRAGIDDVRVFELEDSGRRQQPRPRDRRHACPLGAHYLPLPGEQRDRGDRAARGARRCAAAASAGRSTTSAPLPQPAGAPLHRRRLARRPAAAGRRAAGRRARVDAGRLPPLRRRRRPARRRRRASRSRPRAPRWTPSSPRSTPSTFAHWLDARGPARAGAALVPRLLLPRRLRRRRGAGLGLGRPALLREPARLSCAGRRAQRRARRRADLARRQCLARRRLARRWAIACTRRRVALRVREGRHDVERRRLERGARSAPSAGPRRRSCWRCRCSSPRACSRRRRRRSPTRRARCAMRRGWSPTCTSTQPLDDRPGARAVVGQRVVRQPRRSATSMRMHQSLLPYAGPTVLTAYWALGGDRRPSSPASAARLLDVPWRDVGRARSSQELAPAHPDLPREGRAGRPDALRPCDEHPAAGRAQQRRAARAGRAAAPRPLRAQPTCRATRCSRRRCTTARARRARCCEARATACRAAKERGHRGRESRPSTAIGVCRGLSLSVPEVRAMTPTARSGHRHLRPTSTSAVTASPQPGQPITLRRCA